MELDDLDLGPFVAATRRELERVARQQRLAGIPPAPPLRRRGIRLGLRIAAIAALVAAAIVATATGDLLSAGLRATALQAEHQTAPRGPSFASPRPLASGRPASPAMTVEPTHPAAASPPTAVDPTTTTPRPAAGPEPRDPAATARARSAKLAELERLDAEAQRRWRAGDLAGAEALFLRIVDAGGRTRYAELAFGELFTLAHQTGDTRRAPQRWRRYLARFPRGRFADDVRAWQCRSVTGRDAAACWRRYLADWPRGTYRVEAARALGSQ
jgi:hypothetical protein